ncbi:MAG: hypothetical protein PVF65_01185 [Sphingomonadales bacterium]
MKPAQGSNFTPLEAKLLLKNIMIATVLATGLSACASPLWTGNEGAQSPGTVPRDENGEPIWDKVHPTDGEQR